MKFSFTDIAQATRKVIELEKENTFLREQLRLARSKLFGRSSEKKISDISDKQILLFADQQAAAAAAAAKENTTTTTVSSYERKKKQMVEGVLPEGVRFPLNLERVEEIIDEGPENGEVILEKITERLCAHRSAFYVKRIVRQTYPKA